MQRLFISTIIPLSGIKELKLTINIVTNSMAVESILFRKCKENRLLTFFPIWRLQSSAKPFSPHETVNL